jgi:hypothetical protein
MERFVMVRHDAAALTSILTSVFRHHARAPSVPHGAMATKPQKP